MSKKEEALFTLVTLGRLTDCDQFVCNNAGEFSKSVEISVLTFMSSSEYEMRKLREKPVITNAKNTAMSNAFFGSHWELACLFPVILSHNLWYDLTGKLLEQGKTDYKDVLFTPLDGMIPYIPVFILPYLLTWVSGIVIIAYSLVAKTYDKTTFRYFYFSIFVMVVFENLLWNAFPASISIRVASDVLAENGFLGELTAYVYQNATIWNVFPSAHIAFVYLFYLFSKYFALPGQRWLFVVFFIIVLLSVVFVKNHYVVDIVGGMVMAQVIYSWVFLPSRKHKLFDRLSTSMCLLSSYLVYVFCIFTRWLLSVS